MAPLLPVLTVPGMSDVDPLEHRSDHTDVPASVRPAANWGIDTTAPARRPLSRVAVTAILGTLVAFVALGALVWYTAGSRQPAKTDAAFAALSAYAALTPAQRLDPTALDPAVREQLAAARLLRSADGEQLVLRGEHGCWGVALTLGSTPTALPDALCQ